MFAGIVLLALGVSLIASGVALVIDARRVGTKLGRIGSVWGSLFGDRRWLGREKVLGRFAGLLMFVVGCGAVAAAIPRL